MGRIDGNQSEATYHSDEDLNNDDINKKMFSMNSLFKCNREGESD